MRRPAWRRRPGRSPCGGNSAGSRGFRSKTSEAELLSLAERDAAGVLERVRFSWLKRGNAQNSSWDNTVFGAIEIAGRGSPPRSTPRDAKRPSAAFFRRRWASARYRATEIRSVEQMLAEARESGAGDATALQSAALAEHPEIKARIGEMLEKHYAAWVNDRIPALGGKTPREAVADPAGREAVEALVRQIERDGERMRPPLDPGVARRLRERLGLA